MQDYGPRDTILYALGIGCGESEADLPFVYEAGLRAVPSMAAILGDPGFWLRDPALGADWRRIVHGAQSLTLHAPLPAAGRVTARNRMAGVLDRGPRRGVFVTVDRSLHDAGERLLATQEMVIVLRGDGRRDESPPPADPPPAWPPQAPPDRVVALRTLPQSALIYRLSGDMNPLHADPAVARAAGFPGPILHGLCTMGVATRALLSACCGNDPGRLRHIALRFSAPAFPGETILTEIWEGDGLRFRCRVAGRDAVVLDRGTARIAPG